MDTEIIIMNNVDIEQIRENLSAQVIELEVLQSIYPDELTVIDNGILADIYEFINKQHDIVPAHLGYTIKIFNSGGNVDVEIVLPTTYPDINPEVYARSSSLNRLQQAKLNEKLMNFIEHENKHEPFIYSIISWIQDKLDSYLRDSKKKDSSYKETKPKTNGDNKKQTFARYWVYSHHIYSNIKRKDIVEEAKKSLLTGFCLAGKPGIICVEGVLTDCEDWWQLIKSMNWHKILLKLVECEELDDSQNINELRKFQEFSEISYPSSDKHNDMGKLLKYLTEHNCQYVFKDFFGVEGKLNL